MIKDKNNIQSIIETAIKNVDCILQQNRTVGSPIVNEKGQTVIPVCSVTVGILSGGGEYADVKVAKDLGEQVAGGGITICNMKPSCFIVDNGDGYKIVNTNDSFEVFVKALMKLAEKIKQ